MALDTNEGCQCCGFLVVTLSASAHKKARGKELCRACRCAEEWVNQTPCGQRYCKLCGFLIQPTAPHEPRADMCSACTVLSISILQPGKNLAPCQCDFCSNHYSVSSPICKVIGQSFEPEARKTSADSSSISLEEKRQGSCTGLRENLVEEELRSKWEREQLSLMKKQMMVDSGRVKRILQSVKSRDMSRTFYIAGVDISFIKDNNVDACAALVVLTFPDLKVVYRRLEMIQLTAPYIPGFLAFREVQPLMDLYNTLRKHAPQYMPDVILVDGNGRLHPRAFGLACHLGVMLDVPCVGVAKTLIHVDGIKDNAEHKARKQELKKEGDTFPLTTSSGDTLGMALRTTCSASNPVYVSLGHKISLPSAVTLVQCCSKYRVPEPTRFADLYSRQYLMGNKQEPEEFIATEHNSPPNDWL